jgi:hypothetical protein
MTDVACFCGCLYYFDGSEGPCPQCGAVAVVNTTAIRPASRNREQSQPDAAAETARGQLRGAGEENAAEFVRAG